MDSSWILETRNQGASGRIAHVADPWFACSFAFSPETAGEFYGLTVEMKQVFLFDFIWEDGIPRESVLQTLCAEARRLILAARAGDDTSTSGEKG